MKTDKWKCPSCGREDTEPMYGVCECGTDLERVTPGLVGLLTGSELAELSHYFPVELPASQRHCDLQHMVEIDWLFERCPHSEPLTLATRRECDECMDELLKRKAK